MANPRWVVSLEYVHRFVDSTRLLAVGAALASAFAGFVTEAAAGSADAIAMTATAGADYVRSLDANGKPVPESYVFMEGFRMNDTTLDGSQNELSFDDVTRLLAANLAKQSYFPTRDVAAANLLIRVYWGTTEIFEDPQWAQNIEKMNVALADVSASAAENGMSDTSTLNETIDTQHRAQGGVEAAIARNAALLGYRRSLDREGKRMVATADEQTMRMELAEERYFVVLMAYDYQYMRRQKRPKLVWTTRLSIRGPGNNFAEALPALAVAGSAIFGRNIDGLHRVKVRDLPGGEVTLGELKVIGTVEEPKPGAAAPK